MLIWKVQMKILHLVKIVYNYEKLLLPHYKCVYSKPSGCKPEGTTK